jgi:hypothetical protein
MISLRISGPRLANALILFVVMCTDNNSCAGPLKRLQPPLQERLSPCMMRIHSLCSRYPESNAHAFLISRCLPCASYDQWSEAWVPELGSRGMTSTYAEGGGSFRRALTMRGGDAGPSDDDTSDESGHFRGSKVGEKRYNANTDSIDAKRPKMSRRIDQAAVPMGPELETLQRDIEVGAVGQTAVAAQVVEMKPREEDEVENWLRLVRYA